MKKTKNALVKIKSGDFGIRNIIDIYFIDDDKLKDLKVHFLKTNEKTGEMDLVGENLYSEYGYVCNVELKSYESHLVDLDRVEDYKDNEWMYKLAMKAIDKSKEIIGFKPYKVRRYIFSSVLRELGLQTQLFLKSPLFIIMFKYFSYVSRIIDSSVMSAFKCFIDSTQGFLNTHSLS